jgi:hypothetical protein
MTLNAENSLSRRHTAFESVSQRQRPLYTFETCEIAIEAEDSSPMFDRQRGKMRVRRQIAGGADRPEQSPEYLCVPLAGVHHLRLRMLDPLFDHTERIFDRQRLGKNTAARAQA